MRPNGFRRATDAATDPMLSEDGNAMSMPSDVPELAIPGVTAVGEAEAARCMEDAARMVQEFSAAGVAMLPGKHTGVEGQIR